MSNSSVETDGMKAAVACETLGKCDNERENV